MSACYCVVFGVLRSVWLEVLLCGVSNHRDLLLSTIELTKLSACCCVCVCAYVCMCVCVCCISCSAWLDVMRGRDYLAPASWALTLTAPHLTHNVTHVAVWLAPASSSSTSSSSDSSSSSSGVPAAAAAAASVTMQWIARHTTTSSSTAKEQQRWPELSVGLSQLLLPLQRPVGGPMLLQVNLKQPALLLLQQLLSLRVVQADLPASGSSSNSSSDGICWQPVAVYSSIWGGQQHSLVINTTLSSSSSSVLQQLLQPWLAAGKKVSKHPSSTASIYSSLQLSEVISSPGDTPPLLLLLDPECSYRVQLGWDLVGAGSLLLLGHASTAAGIAVALLLLVLSHQMSSLVRVMTVARHGTQYTNSRAAAAAAAGVEGYFPSRSSSPNQQQQRLVRSHSSSGNSRQRSPSPTAAVVVSSGTSSVLGLASPAAGVARRLVRTTSLEQLNNVEDKPWNDSSSDSESDAADDEHTQLMPRFQTANYYHHQQQQQQHMEQPFVAHSVAHSSSFNEDTQDWNAEQNDVITDAEWGLLPDGQAGFRQPSLTAMQQFRRQMTVTLGGAPPPVEQQLAAAAAASNNRKKSSSRAPSTADNRSFGPQQQQQQQQRGQSVWAGRFRTAALPWPFANSNSSSSRTQRTAAELSAAGDQELLLPGSKGSPLPAAAAVELDGAAAAGGKAAGQQQQQPNRHRDGGFMVSKWAGAGISVLGSLVAVTGDTRVLLLAGLLSAAAGSLNALNPDSMSFHSSHSSHSSHSQSTSTQPSSSSTGGGVNAASRSFLLLQQLLSVLGLQQRGDSPGVLGAAVLLGLALLVLLVAVGVSVGLKWTLDYVIAAVDAFNR